MKPKAVEKKPVEFHQGYLIASAVLAFFGFTFFASSLQRAIWALLGQCSPYGWRPSNSDIVLNFSGLAAVILFIVSMVASYFLSDKPKRIRPILTTAISLQIVLILIAFLFSGGDPGAAVVCNSSDPARILVKTQQFNCTGRNDSQLGTIRLVQITGSDISNVSCVGAGAFAESVPGCLDTIALGKDFELKPNAGKPGVYDKGTIAIEYTDSGGAERSAVITCQGAITVS